MRAGPVLIALSVLLAAGSPGRPQGLKERAELPAHDSWPRCVAFSPDGKMVEGGGEHRRPGPAGQTTGELKVWDVGSDRPRLVLHGHTSGISAVAFRPDGKAVATGAGDKAVKVWDLEAGKEILSVHSPEYGVGCVAFGPDGKTLAYAGYQFARLVDVASGRELVAFKRPGRVMGGAFSPDLKTFAAPNHQDADLFDVATGKERLVLEDHRGRVSRLAFSADGKTLAVASNRAEYPKFFGEVTLWDPATGRRRAVFKEGINIFFALALSPDGKLLAVGGSRELDGPHETRLIDVATGRELAVVAAPGKDWVWGLAFSPDGRLLAGGVGKALRLWEVPSPPAGPK